MTITEPTTAEQKSNGTTPDPAPGLPDTSRDDGPDTMPVLDLSAFTWARRQEAIDLAEEVRAAMATVARVLYEAIDLLAQLNADESRVTSRAYAAKVTTLEGGEDELGETVASLSGSMPLYAALTDLANMADPDSTDNNARRKAWLDEAKGLTAVEQVAEAMREKRVRRLERGVTELGGGYTAEQDGGDLLVRHDGLPVSRNSMLTMATVAAQLEANRSGEVARLR